MVRQAVAPSHISLWQRFVKRIAASDTELDAEDLREASAQAGATPVKACGQGDKVSISGRLTSVCYMPRCNMPTLEAELFDGTGRVSLVWLGRRRIVGITPGQSVTVYGRVATRNDQPVIYNPYYTLEPDFL